MATARKPPGNGFIQRQRNNRSAQYDAEHAEKNIDNGDPNAGQKLWASQILKIFKAVPFFKALNDVGITQRIFEQIKQRHGQNKNKQHDGGQQI